MFYDRISKRELIHIYEGFDAQMNKKLKSCIVTDGVVEKVDDNFLPIDFIDIKKQAENKEKPSEIDIVVLNTCYFFCKQILINNASFIQNFYYVSDEKNNENWCLHNVTHLISNKFNKFDECKFLLYQSKIPLKLISEVEPESINYRELDEKVKTKRLIKKIYGN